MSQTADAMSRVAEEATGAKALVPWYLMASLMYYHFDAPILSDGRFDEIGKKLLANWDDIEHNHKHFITREDLEAGTLALSLEQYPLRTRAAAYVVATGLGHDEDKAIYARIYAAPFVPPEALRNDATLYDYGMQGGVPRSWQQVQDEAKKGQPAPEPVVAVRTRQRPSPAPVIAPQEPITEVRVRVRAPVAVPEPEVRVRTRVRPA